MKLCNEAFEMIKRTGLRSERRIKLALSILIYLMKMGKPQRLIDIQRGICEVYNTNVVKLLLYLPKYNIVKVTARAVMGVYRYAPIKPVHYYFVGNEGEVLKNFKSTVLAKFPW